MLCSRINSELLRRFPPLHVRTCVNKITMEDSVSKSARSLWKKRRVAIILGYIGTNYRGLQLNPDFPSIEKEVMRALHEVGSVSDDNAYKPAKMAWSRSSRTDKGVQASRTVISANILLRPDWPVETNSRLPELVQMINEKLPSDIRVFEIVRMNGGFNARFACHMREYEYLLPLALFNAKHAPPSYQGFTPYFEWSTDPVVLQERLNFAFAKFRGTNDMHNFHRVREVLLRGKKRTRTEDAAIDPSDISNVVSEKLDEQASSQEDNDSDDDEVAVADEDSVISNKDIQYYDPWVVKERHISPQTKSCIYNIEAVGITTINNQSFIKVQIAGQAFLLHQIRLLMSAGILYASGVIPSQLLDIALETPFSTPLPLAPAEGLILTGSAYARNVNDERYHMSAHLAGGAKPLLSAEAEAATQEFLTSQVYPAVATAWNENSVIENYISLIHRKYLVTGSNLLNWDVLLQSERIRRENVAATSKGAQLRRVSKMIAKYEALVPPFKKDYKSKGSGIEFKVFLPNGLATEICNEFALPPMDKNSSKMMIALASAVVRGDICADATAKEIVAMMREKGLEYWMKSAPRLPGIV